MGKHDYAFIAALRAFAALWVLVAHVMIWGGWYWRHMESPKLAVDLFMLLSGFLMVATTDKLDSPNRMRFWLRRFFRIAPAYYLALAMAALLAPWYLGGYTALQNFSALQAFHDPTTTVYDAQNLLWHVSFLFGLNPHYSAATMLPDWSLSLEMQFYFAFPFLALFARRFGTPALLLLCAGVYLAGRVYTGGLDYPVPSFLAMKLHVFAAGMVIHTALQAQGSRRIGAVAGALFLASFGHDMVIGMALVMFAMGLMEQTGDNPIAWLTDNAIVRFLSDVSYGVYLFHGFWIAAFGLVFAHFDTTGPQRVLLMMPGVLVGTLVTGWLVHRYVELPGIALGKRLARKSAPVSAESSTPA